MPSPTQEGICKHCKRRRGVVARYLCRRCYMNQMVRELYPVLPSERLPPGESNQGTNKSPTKLPKPVDVAPGSDEKIAEMADRVQRKESLWHPKDKPMDDGK